MSKKNTKGPSALLKKILSQISGDMAPEDELIPEYTILGNGHIMCYDPNTRTFKRVSRGITAYVIKENYDRAGRSLIYTTYGDVVCIEPEELFLLKGFD
jgi:hypothetical protein